MSSLTTESVTTPDRVASYRQQLLLNSLVAFALALLVSVTVHEFGHGLAAVLLGARPTVFPFSVDPAVDTDARQLVTALAGPLLSLVVGALALALPAPRGGFLRLLLLWFGMISAQTTVGYLMTAPIPNVGDISSAIRYAHLPSWVGFPVFALGLLGMLLLGRVATARLVVLADPADDLPAQVRRTGLLAWLAGTSVAIVLSIGAFDFSAIGFFEVFGVLTSGIFLTLIRLYLPRVASRPAGPIPLGWPIAGAAGLLVVALLRLIVLGPGLTL